jgi:hypothetical protein
MFLKKKAVEEIQKVRLCYQTVQTKNTSAFNKSKDERSCRKKKIIKKTFERMGDFLMIIGIKK